MSSPDQKADLQVGVIRDTALDIKFPGFCGLGTQTQKYSAWGFHFNPLHTKMRIQVLHTDLSTFPMILK